MHRPWCPQKLNSISHQSFTSSSRSSVKLDWSDKDIKTVQKYIQDPAQIIIMSKILCNLCNIMLHPCCQHGCIIYWILVSCCLHCTKCCFIRWWFILLSSFEKKRNWLHHPKRKSRHDSVDWPCQSGPKAILEQLQQPKRNPTLN